MTDSRQERRQKQRADALRGNLQKRKAQQRARADAPHSVRRGMSILQEPLTFSCDFENTHCEKRRADPT